jgi:hypothetical protein
MAICFSKNFESIQFSSFGIQMPSISPYDYFLAQGLRSNDRCPYCPLSYDQLSSIYNICLRQSNFSTENFPCCIYFSRSLKSYHVILYPFLQVVRLLSSSRHWPILNCFLYPFMKHRSSYVMYITSVICLLIEQTDNPSKSLSLLSGNVLE